ncbi:hypothetical protein GUJ93_ZPchr0012g21443 [Zizania palustris]|uniref:Uncharacterized protein n=1 Tax=Zizania palustris TaxID=103762 RepID=A0A8J5WQG8_ZIZPA|nr:hypothetical protein GUJ93_ZPchr0012g21443 [Zizania palustris]
MNKKSSWISAKKKSRHVECGRPGRRQELSDAAVTPATLLLRSVWSGFVLMNVMYTSGIFLLWPPELLERRQ